MGHCDSLLLSDCIRATVAAWLGGPNHGQRHGAMGIGDKMILATVRTLLPACARHTTWWLSVNTGDLSASPETIGYGS